MKSVKQMLIDKEISEYDACKNHYNEMTEEDIDYIVKIAPWDAACYLNQHPLLTQKRVDFIVEKMPWTAVYHLSHKLSEENIDYIAKNHPEYLKEVFK